MVQVNAVQARLLLCHSFVLGVLLNAGPTFLFLAQHRRFMVPSTNFKIGFKGFIQ